MKHEMYRYKVFELIITNHIYQTKFIKLTNMNKKLYSIEFQGIYYVITLDQFDKWINIRKLYVLY